MPITVFRDGLNKRQLRHLFAVHHQTDPRRLPRPSARSAPPGPSGRRGWRGGTRASLLTAGRSPIRATMSGCGGSGAFRQVAPKQFNVGQMDPLTGLEHDQVGPQGLIAARTRRSVPLVVVQVPTAGSAMNAAWAPASTADSRVGFPAFRSLARFSTPTLRPPLFPGPTPLEGSARSCRCPEADHGHHRPTGGASGVRPRKWSRTSGRVSDAPGG
jgi:hypothetical protein